MDDCLDWAAAAAGGSSQVVASHTSVSLQNYSQKPINGSSFFMAGMGTDSDSSNWNNRIIESCISDEDIILTSIHDQMRSPPELITCRTDNDADADFSIISSHLNDGPTESLDYCLLSLTNDRNTDTVTTSIIENDGNGIFSENCKSLWNANIISSDNTNINTTETLVKPAGGGGGGGGDLNYQYLDRIIQSDSSTVEEEQNGFKLLISENNPPKSKRPCRSSTSTSTDNKRRRRLCSSSNINFQLHPSPSVSATSVSSAGGGGGEPDSEAIAQMKEMIYRAAVFRPVNFGTDDHEAAILEKPKRKNVRISSDPQTVAARQRRERISERIRVLQRLVPGGNKMDTASMLDEAANYLKFLRSQVKALEALGKQQQHQKRDHQLPTTSSSTATNYLPLPNYFNHTFPMQSCLPLLFPNSSSSSSCINYQPKI